LRGRKAIFTHPLCVSPSTKVSKVWLYFKRLFQYRILHTPLSFLGEEVRGRGNRNPVLRGVRNIKVASENVKKRMVNRDSPSLIFEIHKSNLSVFSMSI
jgi:hypothetical protein